MSEPDPVTKPSDIVPALSKPIVTIGFADHVPMAGHRVVASEIPVRVAFADIPFGIMMMTPADLEDFACGFSLTEGIITQASDIRGIHAEPQGAGLSLRIDLVPWRLHAHLARKRAIAGRTSCGLCGIEDFESLPRAGHPTGEAPRLHIDAVARALGAMDAMQPLGAATRAVHGAFWVEADGHIRLAREDVGRHNALDKLIGACLRQGIQPANGFVLVTSRASYEMIEKTATFGCRTLVAVSAPTALAIDRAAALDVTLLGIARPDAVTIFCGAERIVVDRNVVGGPPGAS